MKKIISLLLIFTALAAATFAEDDSLDSLKKDLKEAGTSIKESAKNVADDIKKGVADIANEKVPEIKNSASKTTKTAVEKAKEAADTISEKVRETDAVSVTGTLKQALFFKTKFSLKTDDENSYIVKTLSGSDESYEKLSEYKNKKVSVTGVLNKKTNVITMTTCDLAE